MFGADPNASASEENPTISQRVLGSNTLSLSSCTVAWHLRTPHWAPVIAARLMPGPDTVLETWLGQRAA
jgi:hypothetical protein